MLCGVVVEAELGTLEGVEDEVVVEAGKASYTRPEEVEEFVTRTGCDSLAIAIGTSHGAYKFKPEQCTRNADGILVPPPLRFDVLEEVSKRLPGFPIVLHGSSSVPQEFVKMVNTYGGNMPDAIGIPEYELRHAAELSVCKINIDSDIRLAMTGNIRKYFAEHPDHFDPTLLSIRITSIPDSISNPQDRRLRIWSLTRSLTFLEVQERLESIHNYVNTGCEGMGVPSQPFFYTKYRIRKVLEKREMTL